MVKLGPPAATPSCPSSRSRLSRACGSHVSRAYDVWNSRSRPASSPSTAARLVARGGPDQASGLRGVRRVGQRPLGPGGAALLGVRPAVVDPVVEPGGQPYRDPVEGDAGSAELVEPVQHLGEMAYIVIAARGVAVRREEGVAHLEEVLQGPAPEQLLAAGTQRACQVAVTRGRPPD